MMTRGINGEPLPLGLGWFMGSGSRRTPESETYPARATGAKSEGIRLIPFQDPARAGISVSARNSAHCQASVAHGSPTLRRNPFVR